MKASVSNLKDTKLVFLQTGTCSQTLFHILNKEFGNEMLLEERAADALAGGVVYQGKVCGLAIGAILGAGAQAYHESESSEQSICLAMIASQLLLKSFTNRAQTIDCFDITNAKFTSQTNVFKYVVMGKGIKCLTLADKWAPEAIEVVRKAVSENTTTVPAQCHNCATRVVKEMGGNEKERAIVAGLAGGIGLSGNICGALTASIWYNSLKWLRTHPEKKSYPDDLAKAKVNQFLQLTNGECLCPKLSGKIFNSLEEHTDFIREGGCNKLIDILAEVS